MTSGIAFLWELAREENCSSCGLAPRALTGKEEWFHGGLREIDVHGIEWIKASILTVLTDACRMMETRLGTEALSMGLDPTKVNDGLGVRGFPTMASSHSRVQMDRDCPCHHVVLHQVVPC